MPHVPNVMPIEPKELLEFCSDAGYNCRLEPRGSWFTPPDYNVGMTDWERSLRLRCGPGARKLAHYEAPPKGKRLGGCCFGPVHRFTCVASPPAFP